MKKNSGKVYTGKPYNFKQSKPRKPSKRVNKKLFACIDGPFKGQKLKLTDGVTAIFTVGNDRGFYKMGEWIKC